MALDPTTEAEVIATLRATTWLGPGEPFEDLEAMCDSLARQTEFEIQWALLNPLEKDYTIGVAKKDAWLEAYAAAKHLNVLIQRARETSNDSK